jgi:hypothetical protein
MRDQWILSWQTSLLCWCLSPTCPSGQHILILKRAITGICGSYHGSKMSIDPIKPFLFHILSRNLRRHRRHRRSSPHRHMLRIENGNGIYKIWLSWSYVGDPSGLARADKQRTVLSLQGCTAQRISASLNGPTKTASGLWVCGR